MAELAARLKNAASAGRESRIGCGGDRQSRCAPATKATPVAQTLAPRPIRHRQLAPRAEPARVDPDVMIEPFQPEIALDDDHDLIIDDPAPLVPDADLAEGPYIPPAAEMPSTAPRMPQMEDLPHIAQKEIRADHGTPS